MVRVFYSEHFRQHVRKLNEKQQAKLARLIVLLKENPFNPLLHAKRLSGELAGIYSFRVIRDFRALFKFSSPDEIVLLDIGDRKDIYR